MRSVRGAFTFAPVFASVPTSVPSLTFGARASWRARPLRLAAAPLRYFHGRHERLREEAVERIQASERAEEADDRRHGGIVPGLGALGGDGCNPGFCRDVVERAILLQTVTPDARPELGEYLLRGGSRADVGHTKLYV